MIVNLNSLNKKILLVPFTILLLILFNSKSIAQNGIVKTYYASGKVASRLSFIKDVLEGTSYWYYENGNLKEIKNYSGGKLNGIIKSFYSSGLLKEVTHFSQGILDGTHKGFYDNGGLKETKLFSKGKLISVKVIDYDSLYIAPLSAYREGGMKNNSGESDFICSLEICPQPVGGIQEIERKIVYPDLAKKYKLEGFVLVSVKVDAKGKIKNIKVIKELGLGCDKAAIAAINKTKFIPGEENGVLKETEVTFKLNFKIDKNKIPTSNKIIDEQDIALSDSSRKFITCDVDECPEPIGGILTLIKNIRYPAFAKRKKIEGDVVIEANVNELGFVISVKVIKSLGFGCDQAAKTAVLQTQFEPGKKNGKDVTSKIKISVPFILEEE